MSSAKKTFAYEELEKLEAQIKQLTDRRAALRKRSKQEEKEQEEEVCRRIGEEVCAVAGCDWKQLDYGKLFAWLDEVKSELLSMRIQDSRTAFAAYKSMTQLNQRTSANSVNNAE